MTKDEADKLIEAYRYALMNANHSDCEVCKEGIEEKRLDLRAALTTPSAPASEGEVYTVVGVWMRMSERNPLQFQVKGPAMEGLDAASRVRVTRVREGE